jgi:hypothetical protein
MTKALDGRRSILFHATINQKHAGVMEGGWDRPHDHARTLGERDGNDKGDEDDDDKYGKDGDISDEPIDFFSRNNQPKTCGRDGGGMG